MAVQTKEFRMSAEAVQNTLDVAVATTTIASVMLSLPSIVLILTGIYTLMRIVIEWPKMVAAVKKHFKK